MNSNPRLALSWGMVRFPSIAGRHGARAVGQRLGHPGAGFLQGVLGRAQPFHQALQHGLILTDLVQDPRQPHGEGEELGQDLGIEAVGLGLGVGDAAADGDHASLGANR